MKISLERTIQIRSYEPLKYQVELRTEDYPGLQMLPVNKQNRYLYYQGAKMIALFRLQNGEDRERVCAEMLSLREDYGLSALEAELTFVNADPLC